MATYVIRPGSKPRPVRNLGWLLRNWRQVDSFAFYYSPQGMTDGVLSARLKDGRFYRTDFASLVVCFRFLRRPVFDGLELSVHHAALGDAYTGVAKSPKVHVIGSDEYRALLRADAKPFDGIPRPGSADEYNRTRHAATLAAILPSVNP